MPITDKRIDDYIGKSADFAIPILQHLRHLVHQANPNVEETIKWGFASFDYKGPLCSMASFKQHCVFGFWKSKLLHDPEGHLSVRANQGGEAMGNLGRITSLSDLPPDKVLIDFIKEASRLNEAGIKLPPSPKKEKGELVIPDFFMERLKKNSAALDVFEKFSPSNKREYVDWFNEAKSEETRTRRMETALEWIAEGKVRNWKYVLAKRVSK
jgi:uncharacterized protein YdeI (YjbR/CyaY-like superfamily)